MLAKVDANEETNKALASEYEVRGYPTLKIIENKGEIVREYKGPRDANGIVAYLKKQVSPPSEEIKDSEEGHKLVEENDILVVSIIIKKEKYSKSALHFSIFLKMSLSFR